MRILANVALALVACQPSVVAAMQPACMTPKQASALAAHALPSVITGTTKRCSATLTDSAFLKANGEDLAKRYATRKNDNWPDAKAAFLVMSSGKGDANKVFTQLPDDSLREMLDVILEGMVVQEIPVEDCGKIDKFVRLIAPLPPENTAELIVLAMGLAPKAVPPKPGMMAIC